MSIPVCCGRQMSVSIEVGRYIETKCSACGDVVYIKKDAGSKPVMLDD